MNKRSDFKGNRYRRATGRGVAPHLTAVVVGLFLAVLIGGVLLGALVDGPGESERRAEDDYSAVADTATATRSAGLDPSAVRDADSREAAARSAFFRRYGHYPTYRPPSVRGK